MNAQEIIQYIASAEKKTPVKAAMAAMGWCENYVRLPLTTMEPAHWAVLEGLMKAHGLI